MAQAVHAAFLFAQEHPESTQEWIEQSQFIVVVAVPDETTLLDLELAAKSMRIPCSLWREPDLATSWGTQDSGTPTAIALAPIPAAKKLCANLPLAGKPKPAQPQGPRHSIDYGWGIQHKEHYNDYPEWFDSCTPSEEPLRFHSKEEAKKHLREKFEKEYREHTELWVKAKDKAEKQKNIYQQRKQVLIEAGLWESPLDDKTLPLVVRCTPTGRKPMEPQEAWKGWRIVRDSEMEEPIGLYNEYCSDCRGEGEK